MIKEAVGARVYEAEALGKKYPKVQILSVAKLLAGKELQYPQQIVVTFRKAPRKAKRTHEDLGIEWNTGASEPEAM